MMSVFIFHNIFWCPPLMLLFILFFLRWIKRYNFLRLNAILGIIADYLQNPWVADSDPDSVDSASIYLPNINTMNQKEICKPEVNVLLVG